MSSAGEKQAIQQAETFAFTTHAPVCRMPRSSAPLRKRRGMTQLEKVQLNASSRNAFNCA
ncbi:hypothetical protein BF49_0407 [Bradyrhizobium sp.]|nr:hypothetical protein BF49_0407 [Bradyrhizobium sp.]